MDALFDDLRGERCRASPRGPTRRSRRPTASRARAHRARSRPRRSTSCAACCPRRRCRTWASTRRGQTYEQLILHLLAHPLPEARHYGAVILEAVKAVMPSFVARVERPDRGGEWVGYLEARERGRRALGRAARARPRPRRRRGAAVGAAAARRRRRGRAARRAAVRGRRRAARRTTRIRLGALGADERARLLADLVGERAQPPPPPRPRLRGAALPLRDRLRLRRVPRPPAPPHAHRAVAAADAAPRRRRARGGRRGRLRRRDSAARSRSRATEWERLAGDGREREATYALCLGFRIRYVLDLNAREAMQLIELRSGREGHPSYRAVAHEMHRLIGAVHPAVAAAMTHVDTDGRAAARADPVRDAHAGEARRARRLVPRRTGVWWNRVARGTLSGP